MNTSTSALTSVRTSGQASGQTSVNPAKPSRNLAIDAMRVASMGCVVIGHWLASYIGLDEAGKIVGGNGLDKMPSLHWMSWLFQVMPLFFCVGGFANATSLVSAQKKGTTIPTWIALRLRRLLSPVAVFATVWLLIVAVGTLVGQGGMARMGSRVAVIPLWFMAVYVLDIGLAPVLRKLWTTFQWKAIIGVAALVGGLDLLSQTNDNLDFMKLPNAFIGWSVFQLLGMAWHAGSFSPTRLKGLGITAFAAAIGLVAFGPWPISMVQVPNAPLSNTWPPSIALLAFGTAQCCLAMLLAPRLDGVLQRNKKAFMGVMIAASMAMSVYLWHLSALAGAAVLSWPFGGLTADNPGSGRAFLLKVPMMLLASGVLAAIVSGVWRFERNSLLDKRELSVTLPEVAVLVPVCAISIELLTTHGLLDGVGIAAALGIIAVQQYLHHRSISTKA
jgi:Acyltransferase family